jgi:S-(hydroxymethyl)glutathione dehydrogenase/alcohol dehydrogenase
LCDGLPIIAVDTNPTKEAYARQFGATHFICPTGPDFDLVAAVKEIEPNGVNHVFECVGSTALIKTSTDLLDWGGQLIMLGVPKMGSEASFVVNAMYNDKSIMGCRYGSARPQYDIPLMVELYKAGRLKLDELVSETYPLESFQTALDELHDGKLARGVLVLS